MFSAQELKAAKDKARDEARLNKARGQQQEKHWSWLFSTLWTGLRRSPRLHLSVPETVLFEDGAPTKWLGTDADGYLVRRDLEPEAARVTRGSAHNLPNHVRDEFFAAERIKMFALKFEEAWRRGGGQTELDIADEAAPSVCVAEYHDGIREDLNVKQLLYLGSHARWRVQVASLQSRVTSRRTASGSFRRNAKQSLAPRAEAAARAAAALAAGQPEHASRDDLAHLARALAKFAESTYAPAKSRLEELEDDDLGHATVEDLGLEVDALDVEASVDAQGTLWLVRCPICHIRFVNRAPARADAEVFEEAEATREEAKAAGIELRRLLALASKRGVDARASFKHFDAQGLGRVDRAGLMLGLELLGTRITDAAAALLQEDLSGSSIQGFSVFDLDRFSKGGPLPKKDASRAEREDALASQKREEAEGLRHTQTAAELSLERTRTKRLLEGPGQKPMTTGYVARSRARSELSDSESELTQRRKRAPLALSKKELRAKWGGDPLEALPGARNQSRKALAELRNAAKRRRKRLEAEREEEDVRLAEEARRLAKKGPLKLEAEGPAPAPGDESDGEELDDDDDSSSEDDVARKSALAESIFPVADPLSNEDEFYHVQQGVVCTYRYLVGAPHPEPDNRGTATYLEQTKALIDSEAIMDRANKAKTLPSVNNKPMRFLLVVCPDVFMTLDSLQRDVRHLLSRPDCVGDALLVGTPGLPHTVWPRGKFGARKLGNVNNSLQATCVEQLLVHLKNRDRLPRDRDLRIIFLGFGNGACCLAKFAARHLTERAQALADVKAATVALVLVNAFFSANGLKKKAKTMHRVLASAVKAERVAVIEHAHLSPEYITEFGRDKVCKEFWKARKFVIVGEAPEEMIKACRRPAKETGPQGVMAQLRGILDHDDVRPVLNRICVPLVLLQSKKSTFVDCELGPHALEKARVDRAPSITQAVRTGGTVCSVDYVDCGHELNQERRKLLAQTVFEVLGATVSEEPVSIVPSIDDVANKSFLSYDLAEPSVDPAVAAQLRQQREREELEASMQAALEAEEALKIQWERYEDEHGTPFWRDPKSGATTWDDPFAVPEQTASSSSEGEDYESESEVETLDTEESKAPKKKRRSTKGSSEKRRKRAEARRLLALRKAQAADDIKLNEREERFSMRFEDFCSREVRKDEHRLELFLEGADRALDKADYILEQRDEEEAGKLRYQQGVVRTEIKIEKRENERAEEELMVEKCVKLDGEASGGYLSGGLDRFVRGSTAKKDARCPPMREIRESAMRMTRDLFEARSRLVLALQQSLQLEGVVAQFSKSAERADHEARKLQRTLRLLESNRGLRGALAPKPAEIEEMRSAHEAKVAEYQSTSDVLASRERKLRLANRIAQALKVVVAKKEQAAHILIAALDRLGRVLRTKRGQKRLDKTEKELKAQGQRKAIQQAKDRLGKVDVEIGRVKDHHAEFVNSDLWNPGVLQRMSTRDLKASLNKEQQALERRVRDADRELKQSERLLRASNRDLRALDGEAATVEDVQNAVVDTHKEATGRSVMQELKDMVAEQERALKIKEEKEAEENLQARAHKSTSGDCVAARVRHKKATDRSTDEKRWVALDVLINPIAYGHVSEAEAEEMKYDPEYAPKLPPEDIERILALPRVLQLALPFLFSQDEIEAHRLLCQYTHEEGEAHFRSLDKTGRVLEGGLHARRVTSPDHADPLRREVSAGAQSKSAALLDIVLRERRLARLRSKQALELSEEEAKYLVLDRLLHPELSFAPSSSQEDDADDVQALALLAEAHVSAGLDATVGLNQGDEYVAFRTAYERGATDVELHFATKWFPYLASGAAHTRTTLLKLVDAAPSSFEPDEEVRLLLEEFYVDARTDTHGRRKQGAVQQINKQFTAIENDRLRRRQNELRDFPEESSLASRKARGSFDDDGTVEDGLGGDGIPESGDLPFESEELVVQGKAPPVTVCASVEKLNALRPKPKDPATVLFEYEGHHASLLNENESLETRESRTHRFVVPDDTDRKVLSLTITVVYRGVFTARGYRLARVACTLFRVPGKRDGPSPPIPCGYAPYEAQQLNTGTQMGRTVVIHDPEHKPLRAGPYQVVLGAASATKYSITVEAHAVRTAPAELKALHEKGAEHLERLKVCRVATDDLWTSMRLGERKVLVVQGLMDEAEVESSRCERETERCNQELAIDDERMELTDEQRRELYSQVRTLEVEFAHWCRLFASRSQERVDLLGGLRKLREERRKRLEEIETLSTDLTWLQKHVPSATGLISGIEAATKSALALNTTFENIKSDQATKAKWKKLAAVKSLVTSMMTPAEEVRRRHRTEGWNALTLPEQQWVVLDRIREPLKYGWLSDQESAEDLDRERKSLKPLKRKLPRACRGMAGYAKGELDRVHACTFDKLTRQERGIWKLMKRFHNDPQLLVDRRKTGPEGFDPDMAPNTRFKHPKSWTCEERAWASLDKILNPELWVGLKLRSSMKDGQMETADQLQSYLKPSDTVVETVDEENKPPPPLTQKKKAFGGFGGLFGNVVSTALTTTVEDAAALATEAGRDWHCPLSRGQIMEVWAASRPQAAWDADRCKAHVLLRKFNGDFAEFFAVQKQQLAQMSREAAGGAQNRLARDLEKVSVETDLDARCRQLQTEMDAAINNSNAFMNSSVLHGGVAQRYPTTVLRLELERELDTLLREQVYERERATRFLLEQDDPDAAFETDSSDEEDKAKKSGIKKPDHVSKNVFQQRKAALAEAGKDEATKMLELELQQLGPKACLGCRKATCAWTSSVDWDHIKLRRQQISDELVYVRMSPDVKVLESYVPLSAARGGNPHFKRDDLLYELNWEDKQLAMRSHLDALDRELHDAHATNKEYMEVKALHGYATMMWTNNARRALEREHNRYVATVVASDIVDDALEWMLEGWHFGERESRYSVAGYVPSLKSDGFVRAGTDQVLAQADAEEREEKRRGVPRDEAVTGSPRTKAEKIEVAAQFRLTNEKVAKDGNDHEKHLDFTETTLKFGLFCITLMFFRAMSLVRRERDTFSGTHDAVGSSDAPGKPTNERRKMRRETQKLEERQRKMQHVLNRAKVGEERTRKRLVKEKAEAASKLHEKVRREKRELTACAKLQAFYRGHLGRKAARRWAVKRAELEAMNALMTASAITIERVFRGYMGRIAASVARMEMAEFISMIRLEEAQGDEDEYWRTHGWARLKRNVMMFVQATFEKKTDLAEQDMKMIQQLTSAMDED